ncbi:hypothetical protein LTR17_023292 [Elasticomyces elasticus]|nr:hypothetical protein LTR17_023292 [Elasticomyces elasticus]
MSQVGSGNTSPVLTTVTVLIFIWAIVAFLIRLYVKLSRAEGVNADDGAISAAVVAALAQLVTVCYAVHRGYGTSWDDVSLGDRKPIVTALFASQILYVISIGATRISIGYFTTSVLARDASNLLIARTLTGFCATWTIASIFLIALRGDLSEPWNTLNGSETMWIRWVIVDATGFACDIAAAAVVAYFVSSLEMNLSKKLTVCGILNSRLLLGVPIALRLYFLLPEQFEKNDLPADILSQVVVGTAIIFASLICLKPFLRPFDEAAFGSKASRSGLFRYTNDHDTSREQYYELSAARSGRNNDTTNSARSAKGRRLSDDEAPLTEKVAELPNRPDAVGHQVDVKSGMMQGNGKSGGKSISKTQSWHVTVGEAR